MTRRKSGKGGKDRDRPRKRAPRQTGKKRLKAASRSRKSKTSRKARIVPELHPRPRKSPFRRMPAVAARLVQRLKPAPARYADESGLDRNAPNYPALAPPTFL